MLVPLKGAKGVNMRRLAIGGPKSSGTTFIEMDDVEVPVGNLIGEEGLGMRYIMVKQRHLLSLPVVVVDEMLSDEFQP